MGTLTRIVGLITLVGASVSCGDVVRTGRAPVFLTIDSLLGSRGNTSPGPMTNPLISDVITNVTSPPPCTTQSPCPTIFDDVGQVTLRTELKDIGSPSNPVSSSTNNDVTITRYHVQYTRADGRNTPGIDVPYPFDGAVTGTIQVGSPRTLTFELVRHAAKLEAPLLPLRVSPTIITTISYVTFYGQDRVGNEITATGTVQVDFGNFGD